jgi:hypothetical protein
MTATDGVTHYTWETPAPRRPEAWFDRFLPTFLVHSYWMWIYKILVAFCPAPVRARAAALHARRAPKREGRR